MRASPWTGAPARARRELAARRGPAARARARRKPDHGAEARARQDPVLGRAALERRHGRLRHVPPARRRRRRSARRPASRRRQRHDRRRHGLAGHRRARPRRPRRGRTRCSARHRKSRRGSSPSNFAALWADELFWDGRARPEVKDPLTGKIAIARGGALENQALAALLNDAEMAKAGRSWADVAADLTRARPLALATSLPPDTAAAIAQHATYPALFDGRVRRRRDHAAAHRVRARDVPTHARRRRDAVRPLRCRRHDGADGPRALRLARAAGVSLHGVPHAAAVHEQRVLPDRPAPRRFRSRPRERHGRPRGRRRDESAELAQRRAARALHAHGRVHEPGRGDPVLHQHARAARARRHSRRRSLHLQYEQRRRERSARVHRDGAHGRARARRDVSVRPARAAQRTARDAPASP